MAADAPPARAIEIPLPFRAVVVGADETRVYVTGAQARAIVGFDLASGAESFRLAVDEDVSYTSWVAGGAIVHHLKSADALVAWDIASGARRWTTAQEAPPFGLTPIGGRLFGREIGADGVGRITALDLETGAWIGPKPLAPGMPGRLVPRAGSVWTLTRGGWLVAVDARTLEKTAERALDASVIGQGDAPPIGPAMIGDAIWIGAQRADGARFTRLDPRATGAPTVTMDVAGRLESIAFGGRMILAQRGESALAISPGIGVAELPMGSAGVEPTAGGEREGAVTFGQRLAIARCDEDGARPTWTVATLRADGGRPVFAGRVLATICGASLLLLDLDSLPLEPTFSYWK